MRSSEETVVSSSTVTQVRLDVCSSVSCICFLVSMSLTRLYSVHTQADKVDIFVETGLISCAHITIINGFLHSDGGLLSQLEAVHCVQWSVEPCADAFL